MANFPRPEYTIKNPLFREIIKKWVEDIRSEHGISSESVDDIKMTSMVSTFAKQAMIDQLTGLFNLAAFRSDAHQAIRNPNYMFFFDMDNFKSVNDNWGHPIGDQWLKYFSSVIFSFFPQDKFNIFRYGGDEFVITINRDFNLNRKNMLEVLQKMGKFLSANPLEPDVIGDHNIKIPVRFSTGVVELVGFEKLISIDAILSEVDKALYQIKHKAEGLDKGMVNYMILDEQGTTKNIKVKIFQDANASSNFNIGMER